MLQQLTIANFAIINHLEIGFKPGLNILSGETGAGKSIIINAVNLILGGRASADLIRSGAEEATVEALFNLGSPSAMPALLREMGLPAEGEDLIIKRHISRSGRNRILINGSLASLQMLSRVGLMLISISGQHEHQRLLKPDSHLALLDDFGGLCEIRSELNELFRKHQELQERCHGLERAIQKAEEQQDLTQFQIEEIDKAAIRSGEDRQLEAERKLLQHAEELKQIMSEAYQQIYDREEAVLVQMARCQKSLQRGAEIDQRLKKPGESLGTLKVGLQELALELRDLQQTVIHDPERLEAVEERLQLLHKLKKKYGSSLEEVLHFRANLTGQITNLDRQREELKTIQGQLKELEETLLARAGALSAKRQAAAKKMEKAVMQELNLLDMAGTRFGIHFFEKADESKRVTDLKADGFDQIEFLLSPNVGEELKPLARIASGGELSRIMLALKTILARTSSVETVIFDEVDSGIGGATSEVVGEKLQSLAAFHQILCITHLPQIASKGTTHFLVKKKVIESRAQTVILELDSEARVKEIARLLGGKVISQQALAHAHEMMHFNK
jgi:DNA repair protein RecN (Recombination protein N)